MASKLSHLFWDTFITWLSVDILQFRPSVLDQVEKGKVPKEVADQLPPGVSKAIPEIPKAGTDKQATAAAADKQTTAAAADKQTSKAA